MRLRRGGDFGFGKRQTGHFHDANSIRLPITSLPAYVLLTIVCFFSALPKSTVVPLPEKSLPVPSGRDLVANPRMSRDSRPRRTVVALAPNFARSFRRTVAYDPRDNRANLAFASRFPRSDGHRWSDSYTSRSLISKNSVQSHSIDHTAN